MKQTLRLWFTDFWDRFIPADNLFYNLLSPHYSIVLDEKQPDLLIYSCFGKEYLQYNCTRLFYCAENMRPDFNACDYALTFDFNNDKRHLRYPLYGYYIDMFPKLLNVPVDNLFVQRSREELKKQWMQKKKFCCIVVSNGASKKRIEFFKKLNAIKPVDSGGMVLNNVGGPVKSKIDFIKDYRFVISFENSSHEGYITEKILEPLLTDSIPLYWGNPKASLDFNEKRFLNYHAFKTEDDFINAILYLENNPDKAIDMITAAPFPGGFVKPADINDERLLKFLQMIIAKLPAHKPVAQTYRKHLHSINQRMQAFRYSLRARLSKFSK